MIYRLLPWTGIWTRRLSRSPPPLWFYNFMILWLEIYREIYTDWYMRRKNLSQTLQEVWMIVNLDKSTILHDYCNMNFVQSAWSDCRKFQNQCHMKCCGSEPCLFPWSMIIISRKPLYKYWALMFFAKFARYMIWTTLKKFKKYNTPRQNNLCVMIFYFQIIFIPILNILRALL